VLVFEFKGYQSTYVSTLPSPEQVPLFAALRLAVPLLLKATAPAAHDRFQSADEMREQLLGVLREVIRPRPRCRSRGRTFRPRRSIPTTRWPGGWRR
jgi:serine/threonine-protein kinase PknG